MKRNLGGRGSSLVALLVASSLCVSPSAFAGSLGGRSVKRVPSKKYFPLKKGSWRKYAIYYASREHGRQKLVPATFWDVVVAEERIGSSRVLAVQESKGSLSSKDGRWVYGAPERVLREKLYVVTRKGVFLLAQYRADSKEQYRTRRADMLGSLRADPKALAAGDSYILPFPVRKGVRRTLAYEGSYYKILRVRSGKFVPRRYRKGAVGVAGFLGNSWSGTRWFSPGRGMVLEERLNRDSGVDKDRFPYKVRVMLSGGNGGASCFSRGTLSDGIYACPRVTRR